MILSLKKAAALSALAVTASMGANAFAQEASTEASTTKVEQKSKYQKARDASDLSYTMIFYGPSVAAPLNRTQPNEGTSDFKTGGAPITLRHQISAGAPIPTPKNRGNWAVASVLDFYTTPVHVTDPTTEVNVYLRSVDARLKMANLVKVETKAGEFTFSPDLRLIPGAGRAQRAANMYLGIGSWQRMNFQVGKSIFSASLSTFIEQRMYHATGNGKGSSLVMFANPGINLQFTDKVAAWTSIEFDAAKGRHRGSSLAYDGTYWDLGMTFNPHPQVTIFPFLDFKPGQKDFGRMTSMHLVLSASIL